MKRKPLGATGASNNPNVYVHAEEIEEEADYVNAAVDTVDETAATPEKKCLSCTQSFLQIAVCWVILLVIVALQIYCVAAASVLVKLTCAVEDTSGSGCSTALELLLNPKYANATSSHGSEQNQLKENQTILVDVGFNKLSSENENLRRDNFNLTQAYAVLESKTTNLISQNQQLKVVMNNLTEQIRSMETKWNELNISRAQWSIDAFCPKNKNRKCQPCQEGWLHFQSSCYAINNAKPPGQKTWKEAREDCRGKISDLAVVTNQEEKSFISNNSWSSSGINGYWIGLRAEDGRWKWVDGSDLTESSWIQKPPVRGQCVISVQNQKWRPVSCGNKNGWICWKKALSV